MSSGVSSAALLRMLPEFDGIHGFRVTRRVMNAVRVCGSPFCLGKSTMKSSILRTLLFSTVAIGGSCGVIWWTWGRTPAGDTLAETSAERVESVAPSAETSRVELTADKVTNAMFVEGTAETTELLH